MLGWQCERLVQRVRVKRLRSTQHRCQRLNGHTNNIVVRLLRRERAACGLRVESKHRGTRILRMESLGHYLVPDFSRGPIFRDLLEKIIVRIEEERKPGRKIVYVETGTAGALVVIEVLISSSGIPLNKVSISASESIATPHLPISPFDMGWSES